MTGGLIAVLVIVAVGTRALDDLRRQEAESILHRLPIPQAHAYYEALRRRMRRLMLMRALSLVSLLLILLTIRQHLTPGPPAAALEKPEKPEKPERIERR